jgi:TetR/AcrR family transcriptional regulator
MGRTTWQRLRDAGIAAPIDPAMVYYVIVGAASLPFVDAPEARLLTGTEPTDHTWVAAHADGIVSTLLPGLSGVAGVPARGRNARSRK